MKKFSRSEGKKKEKYKKKLENWKKAYPEYVDFVANALEKSLEKERKQDEMS